MTNTLKNAIPKYKCLGDFMLIYPLHSTLLLTVMACSPAEKSVDASDTNLLQSVWIKD